jgi:hypothetical protein
VAAAISLLMQIGISMLAYTVQLSIVRWVPGKRRRMVWTGLRLLAALSLATIWMLGTWVMRAPAELATYVAAIAPALAFSPSMLVSAPLAAMAQGEPLRAALALAALVATVGAAMLLVIAVARRAGMAGWEEAGAVWAEAAEAPRPNARLLTAATKDLTLITRDRSQLLALIAMPVIFVGVQIFGAAGWNWTTASLDRISWLAYSLALYMGTIGPLTHMQAERKAFWILRTVPVPLARLLAAKARAWALIVGSIGALVFAVLSVSVPDVSMAERLAAGLLVTAGAAGMSFVAVAMASAGADLSDETSSAVGFSTIYAYMFVGGLFNLVLGEDGPTRVAGLVLYGFAGWTYWHAGVEQAEFCLDAEAVRERRVRAADGATMLIIYALGGRALAKVGKSFSGGEVAVTKALLVIQIVLTALIGIAAAIYLARRAAAARPRASWRPSLAIAAAAGAVGGGIVRAATGGGGSLPAVAIVPIALTLLVDEAVLRGIVQRGLPVPRAAAAAITVVAGVVSAQLSASAFSMGAAAFVALTVSQAAGAAVFALSGRVAAAWVARLVLVGLAAFA